MAIDDVIASILNEHRWSPPCPRTYLLPVADGPIEVSLGEMLPQVPLLDEDERQAMERMMQRGSYFIHRQNWIPQRPQRWQIHA